MPDPWSEVYKEWKKANPQFSAEDRGYYVRGCVRKAAYSTFLAAAHVANKLPLRDHMVKTIYPCEICHRFHIGNQKASNRQIMRSGQHEKQT